MSAAAKFGVLWCLAALTIDEIGSTTLWTLFWGMQAIAVSRAAQLTWQRTGLWWMSVEMAHGAIFCAALVIVHAFGYTLLALPYPWQLLFFGNAVMIAVMQFVCSREDRDKWRRWGAHMENVSLFDIIRLRHIPNLR